MCSIQNDNVPIPNCSKVTFLEGSMLLDRISSKLLLPSLNEFAGLIVVLKIPEEFARQGPQALKVDWMQIQDSNIPGDHDRSCCS